MSGVSKSSSRSTRMVIQLEPTTFNFNIFYFFLGRLTKGRRSFLRDYLPPNPEALLLWGKISNYIEDKMYLSKSTYKWFNRYIIIGLLYQVHIYLFVTFSVIILLYYTLLSALIFSTNTSFSLLSYWHLLLPFPKVVFLWHIRLVSFTILHSRWKPTFCAVYWKVGVCFKISYKSVYKCERAI